MEFFSRLGNLKESKFSLQPVRDFLKKQLYVNLKVYLAPRPILNVQSK